MSLESENQIEIPKRTIAIVETSEAVKNQARDIAERNLEKQLKDTKGLKGIILEIWKGNLFRELYLTKEIAEVRKKILQSGNENIYAGETDDRSHHLEAMTVIINRFISEYDENWHQKAGEKKKNYPMRAKKKLSNLKYRSLLENTQLAL